MKEKSWTKIVIVVGIVVGLSMGFTQTGFAEEKDWGGVKFVRGLGGPSGSGAYALYCKLASIWDKIEGIKGSCLAGSSKPNIKAINEGKSEAGYSVDVHCSDAMAGIGYFKGYDKKVKNVSFLTNQFPRGITFVVRADSPLKRIEDIKSKHIAFGPKGYGANSLAYAVLDSYGINEKTLAKTGGRISKMTVSSSCAGLRDKTVDVQCISVGPTGIYRPHVPLEEQFGLRFLPIGEKEFKMTREKFPKFPKIVIPGGLYKNQSTPYVTIGMTINMICSSKLPADLVYKILEVLYSVEGRKAVYGISKGFLPFILENGMLGKATLPVHPGALKFYKDKGVITPPDAPIVPKSIDEALNKYGGQWAMKDIQFVKP